MYLPRNWSTWTNRGSHMSAFTHRLPRKIIHFFRIFIPSRYLSSFPKNIQIKGMAFDLQNVSFKPSRFFYQHHNHDSSCNRQVASPYILSACISMPKDGLLFSVLLKRALSRVKSFTSEEMTSQAGQVLKLKQRLLIIIPSSNKVEVEVKVCFSWYLLYAHLKWLNRLPSNSIYSSSLERTTYPYSIE